MTLRTRSTESRRAQIQELLSLRTREGLTWKQLSARSGIPVSTLASWQRRLKSQESRPGGFVELLPGTGTFRGDFQLELADGLRVHVPKDFDPAALVRLLAAVGRSC